MRCHWDLMGLMPHQIVRMLVVVMPYVPLLGTQLDCCCCLHQQAVYSGLIACASGAVKCIFTALSAGEAGTEVMALAAQIAAVLVHSMLHFSASYCA